MSNAANPLEPQVTVRLAPDVFEGLTVFADREELELPDAVEVIVRDKVKHYLKAAAQRRIDAESELMEFVRDVIRDLRRTGNWNEHVTGALFKRIKAERLDVYADAVGGNAFSVRNHEKSRINRKIGARVKQLLKAEVKIEGGQRQKGQPSRAENALVLSYSLLRRPQSDRGS